jgi:hypothetical protein
VHDGCSFSLHQWRASRAVEVAGQGIKPTKYGDRFGEEIAGKDLKEIKQEARFTRQNFMTVLEAAVKIAGTSGSMR